MPTIKLMTKLLGFLMILFVTVVVPNEVFSNDNGVYVEACEADQLGPPDAELIMLLNGSMEYSDYILKAQEVAFIGPGEYVHVIVILNIKSITDDANKYYYPLLTGYTRADKLESLFTNPDTFGQLIHYTELGYSIWN